METEFEVKVLDIDVDLIKEKLESLGAEFIGDIMQNRYVYNTIPKKKDSWIRLRKRGDETTLCLKEIRSEEIDGVGEIEFNVADFQKAHEFLERSGLKSKGYQENRRISYILDGVNIEIDFWPKLNPYLEIEGKSKEDVYKISEKLNIPKEKLTTRNTGLIYLDNGIDLEARENYDLRF